MADKIVSCVKTKDDADVIIQYDVAYEVENGDASKKNSFCVVVKADELTDPSDIVASDAEVLSLANPKALAIKTAWLADLADVVNEDVSGVVGDVTLS